MRMLKRISLAWYEWVAIAAVLVLLFGGYVQTKRLNATQHELAVSEHAVAVAEQITQETQIRQQVNDESAVMFINEQRAREKRRAVAKETLFDDYLVLLPDSSDVVEKAPEPSSKPIAESPPPKPKEPTKTQQRASVADNGDERVAELARGMHDIYCRANPTDADCPPTASS